MAKAELIYDQTFSARNFNSSPLTVSGLAGDTYDYTVIVQIVRLSGGGANYLQARLNGDTGSNFRHYRMQGAGAANASTDDSDVPELMHVFNTSTVNFCVANITGSSGDERYIDVLSGCNSNGTGSGQINVQKNSIYWTNTADEFSSIEFYTNTSTTYDAHIIIYRNLKQSSQSRWELMKTLEWSTEATEKSFTVNGDRDKNYRIDWVGDQELNLELNDDTTTYIRQYLQNAGGSLSANNSVSEASIVSDGTTATFYIHAETGVKRLVKTTASNTSSAQQSERYHWYDDTATNLTSLELTPTSSATGTAKLYRAKNPNTTADILPFETVKKVDVSGDFSSGDTFNIDVDTFKLVKIEGLFSTVGNDLRMQIDGDTGSNYTDKYLKGVSSSTSTSDSTTTYHLLCDASASKVAQFTYYLYPKSGENRPGLLVVGHGEDSIEYKALWWEDSASAINSFKIFASSTTTCTGTITYSILR